MHIGIDTRLVFYQKAGIGQYILGLTNALAEIDRDDEFSLLHSRKDQNLIVHAPNFKHHALLTPSHHQLETLSLSAELIPLTLDILHSPDFIPPRFMRNPSVITVHDLAFLLYPRFLTPQSARYYGQVDSAARRATHIIAVSQSTKRDIERLLGIPSDKITVIYEAAHSLFKPLDNSEAKRHVATTYGLDSDFILFVSTIEPRKNLPMLLEAFRKLRGAYGAPVTLAVAGRRGWLMDEIDTIVNKLQLNSHVRFLDAVPNEELLYLYNAARALALPSFYEGFGLPALEAMACGTPVVVSNTASLPEVVGDAGQLVDPNDVEAWSATLSRVLSDENLRAEMREKGLRRAASFSWQRAASETLNVYRKAAGKLNGNGHHHTSLTR